MRFECVCFEWEVQEHLGVSHLILIDLCWTFSYRLQLPLDGCIFGLLPNGDKALFTLVIRTVAFSCSLQLWGWVQFRPAWPVKKLCVTLVLACSGHLGSVFTLVSIHLEMYSPRISIHLGSVFTLKCIYLGKFSPCNVLTWWCIHLGKYSPCKSIHHGLQFT